MRFSVCIDPQRPWTEMRALGRHADATGWDGIYICDHFMPYQSDGLAASGPILKGWTTLAALAASTERVRLGTLVLGNTYRHPAVVANMAATLDHISGGRFLLGLGAGWQVNEHAAYGIPLPLLGRRLDALEEACLAIRSLLTQQRTTIDGATYKLSDATCEPKPVQARLPLLIGGGGERRTIRIAARLADIWHVWATADEFRRKCKVLDDHCAEVGRNPAEIRRCSGASVVFLTDAEQAAELRRLDPTALVGAPVIVAHAVEAYGAAGADEFIVSDDASVPVDRFLRTLDTFWAQVAARFR